MGVLPAVLLTMVARGSFDQLLLVALLFLGCVVSTVCWLGWIVVASYGGLRLGPGTLAVAGFLLGSLAHVPGVAVGAGLNRADVNDARSYGDALIVRLDKHRAEHGRFPTALEALTPPAPPPPRLLEGETYYWVGNHGNEGNEFTLRFSDPAGMLDGWEFWSADRVWRRSD